jgi:hypothetical protein
MQDATPSVPAAVTRRGVFILSRSGAVMADKRKRLWVSRHPQSSPVVPYIGAQDQVCASSRYGDDAWLRGNHSR